MKKGMIACMCLIIGIMVCACGSNSSANTNQQAAASTADASITFRNHAEEADVWILPHEKDFIKNPKWGEPTIKGHKKDEVTPLSLEELGGPGNYIVRVIDANDMFYVVDEVPLEDGYTLWFNGGDTLMETTIEVTDTKGKVVYSHHAFEGDLY